MVPIGRMIMNNEFEDINRTKFYSNFREHLGQKVLPAERFSKAVFSEYESEILTATSRHSMAIVMIVMRFQWTCFHYIAFLENKHRLSSRNNTPLEHGLALISAQLTELIVTGTWRSALKEMMVQSRVTRQSLSFDCRWTSCSALQITWRCHYNGETVRKGCVGVNNFFALRLN
jgi:hypothetical protein